MILLGAVAIGYPHLRARAVHGFAHHHRRAGERRFVHHCRLAAKHPLVGVDAFYTHAGLVAGNAVGPAQKRERLAALLFEGRRGAREHVHERALAQPQAEEIEKQPLQAFIGERLEALQISGERVNARAKRGRLRNGGRRSLRCATAACAADRKAPMPPHEGAHRRNLQLVIFADQLGGRAIFEGETTMFAVCRDMVPDLVGMCGKIPLVALVTGLGSTRLGVVAPLLAIRRRRLG